MYVGDFLEDEPNIQLDIDTLVNGDMVALAGTPTVAVYKDNSDTEHTTTYTPAVVDSATGAYRIVIDSSAHAFFATGCDYTARFKTGTLGGKSLVGRLVGSFSIENRNVILANKAHGGIAATLRLQTFDVINSGGDAVTFRSSGGDGSGLRCTGSGLGSGFITIKGASGYGWVTESIIITGATEFTGAVTASNASNNIVGIDVAKIAGTAQTAKDLGAINVTNLNTLSSHDPGATLGTSTLTQAQVSGGAYAINSSSFSFNSGLDFTTTQKSSLGTAVGTAQTGDSYAIVSSGTHGNAAIKGYVDDIGVAGAGLTAIPWNTAWAAPINAEADTALADAKAGYATAIEAAILDEGDATALLAAIAAKVEEFLVNEGDATATIAAIATAVNAAILAGTVGTNVAAILEDTGTTIPATLATAQADLDILTGTDGATLATAQPNYTPATATALASLVTTIGVAGAGLTAADDAVIAAIAGLNNLSAADVNAEVDTALADYDGPTNAEMVARTLLAADYFDPAADVVAHVTLVDTCTVNSDMRGTDGAYTGTPPTPAEIDTQLSGAHGATSWVTASGFAVAGDPMTLTSGERDAIAAALLDLADGVETSVTLRKALRAIAAVAAGKRSNSGTSTEQFDAIGNPGTARVVGNMDSDGNGTPTLTL